MKYLIIAKELLRKHEGLRLKPYTCTAGKLTIGYGRNIEDNGISKEEAEMLLDNDVKGVDDTLRKTYDWYNNLSVTRRVVILDMAFNLGIYGLGRFKRMIKAIELKDYESASMEMLDSLWAKQVGRRALTLSSMMKNNRR